MKVGLVDFGHTRPNLALMKLSSYHKTCGDSVYLNRLSRTGINYVSVVFDRHRDKAERLLKKDYPVLCGGPGYVTSVTLPEDVDKCIPDYSLYGVDYGLGRLTVGCPNDCEYCVVPHTEGRVVRTINTVDKLINGDRVVLYDANFLASVDAPDHLKMIQEMKLKVCFDQGLDIRLVNDFYAHLLSRTRVTDYKGTKAKYYFAWDKPEIEHHVVRGIHLLTKAGIKPYKMTFYVLCGYNTTIQEDLYRVLKLRSLGVKQFVMKYHTNDRVLNHLARWCNVRQIFNSCTFPEYLKEMKRRPHGL